MFALDGRGAWPGRCWGVESSRVESSKTGRNLEAKEPNERHKDGARGTRHEARTLQAPRKNQESNTGTKNQDPSLRDGCARAKKRRTGTKKQEPEECKTENGDDKATAGSALHLHLCFHSTLSTVSTVSTSTLCVCCLFASIPSHPLLSRNRSHPLQLATWGCCTLRHHAAGGSRLLLRWLGVLPSARDAPSHWIRGPRSESPQAGVPLPSRSGRRDGGQNGGPRRGRGKCQSADFLSRDQGKKAQKQALKPTNPHAQAQAAPSPPSPSSQSTPLTLFQAPPWAFPLSF